MVMATSFKRTYACTVLFSAPDLTAGCCRPTTLPETPGHSQASLVQCLVGTLFFSPGVHTFCVCLCVSVCVCVCMCALQESVSPVLWKFCNQIPLASEVKFPGSSQSLTMSHTV